MIQICAGQIEGRARRRRNSSTASATISERTDVHLAGAVLFCWFVIAAMAAIAIDPYLIISALGYLAAFLIGEARPAWDLYVVTGGNLVFFVSASWRWRPSTFARDPAS